MIVKIDASALACPMPLLKAKQALRKSPLGTEVQVLTSDPASIRDFGVYAEHAQLKLVCEQEGPLYLLTLSPS